MLIAFANNQTLVSVGSTTTTIFTDPVPLGNNDRLTAMLNVHSLVKTGGTTGTLSYTAQVSNDGGQNYVDSASVVDSVTGTGVEQVVGTVNAALVRFKFSLLLSGGASSDVLACCFDLHVNMDHV
jgi:hypothetical protein